MSLENNILLGVLGVLFILSMRKSNVVEGFGMNPPRQVKVEKVVQEQNPKTGESCMYSVPSNYQASVAPRQAAGMVDYGAFIRYKMPDQSVRGDSSGSLPSMMNKTSIIEGFDTTKETKTMPLPAYSNMIPQPLATEGAQSVNALGEVQPQPIVYDRYIYANQKQRNLFGADFIRGDIPIPPAEKGWFRPTANPGTDLRDGAMAVLGGLDNDSTRQMMALKSAASGLNTNTGSGIKYTVDKSAYMSAGGGDLQVKTTAFP